MSFREPILQFKDSETDLALQLCESKLDQPSLKLVLECYMNVAYIIMLFQIPIAEVQLQFTALANAKQPSRGAAGRRHMAWRSSCWL